MTKKKKEVVPVIEEEKYPDPEKIFTERSGDIDRITKLQSVLKFKKDCEKIGGKFIENAAEGRLAGEESNIVGCDIPDVTNISSEAHHEFDMLNKDKFANLSSGYFGLVLKGMEDRNEKNTEEYKFFENIKKTTDEEIQKRKEMYQQHYGIMMVSRHHPSSKFHDEMFVIGLTSGGANPGISIISNPKKIAKFEIDARPIDIPSNVPRDQQDELLGPEAPSVRASGRASFSDPVPCRIIAETTRDWSGTISPFKASSKKSKELEAILHVGAVCNVK